MSGPGIMPSRSVEDFIGAQVATLRERSAPLASYGGHGPAKRSVWSLPSILSTEAIPANSIIEEGMAVDGRNGPSEDHADAWLAEMLR